MLLVVRSLGRSHSSSKKKKKKAVHLTKKIVDCFLLLQELREGNKEQAEAVENENSRN